MYVDAARIVMRLQISAKAVKIGFSYAIRLQFNRPAVSQ